MRKLWNWMPAHNRNCFTKDRSLAIKGFAICAMLFHHCFFRTQIYSEYCVDFSPFPEYLVNNIALFGKLCVGTFAFLSGYGLSLKWRNSSPTDKKTFFLTRYLNTMSGYWFAFIVCGIFCELIDGRTTKIYCTGTALENLTSGLMSFLGISRLMGTPMLIYEWWYMGAAILFILLIPVLNEAMDRMGTLAVLVLIILIPRMLGIAFLGGTHPLSFLMAAALGIAFEKNYLFDKIHNRLTFHQWWGLPCKMLFGIMLMILAYKLYHKLPFEQYWEIKYGIIPTFVIVCLNETILNLSLWQKILVFLGKHSMNMYLVHMIFLTYYKPFLFNNRHFMFSWCGLMALSLGVSLIFEWLKKIIRWNKVISFFTMTF